ncbi:hypothetical protein ACVWZ3_001886 [Bradyrhizobium sp. i1.3.6]
MNATWCQVPAAIAVPPAARCVLPPLVTSTNATPLSNPTVSPFAPSLRENNTAPGCGAIILIQSDQLSSPPSAVTSEGEPGSVSAVCPSRRAPCPMMAPSAAGTAFWAVFAQAVMSCAGVERSLK